MSNDPQYEHPTESGTARRAVPSRASLADFRINSRVLLLVVMAIVVGSLGTLAAWALSKLIALASNIAYFGHWSFATVSIAETPFGVWRIGIPVLGGLIIGLMARYGSEKIRGHGIPEAIEAIQLGGSRIQPKVAILKPLSSAISIGSGGPFGAEGPIIMTGGAWVLSSRSCFTCLRTSAKLCWSPVQPQGSRAFSELRWPPFSSQ